MRGTVRESASMARERWLGGWRQYRHIIGKILKKSVNRVRISKQIRKSPERVGENLGNCRKYLMRAEHTLWQLQALELTGFQLSKALQLQGIVEHARRQLEQVTRHLINEEKIPHEEKVFSIFEPQPAGL